mgnify:CR=1 FL=1
MDRRKNFFWWKIILTVISFILIILTKSNIDFRNITNNYFDIILAKEIAYDLSIGIFSALVLVWFIDEINDNIQEKIAEKKEVDAIMRADKIIQQYIKHYEKFYYCVSTPIGKRNFNNMILSVDFTLKDIRDLYKTTTLMNDDLFTSSIERFLFFELELRKNIEFTIRSVNFEYHPQFALILSNYIETSIKYDNRSVLLGNKNVTLGTEPYETFISKLLEDEGEQYYKSVMSQPLRKGCTLNPYVYLVVMMKEEYRILNEYKKEIEKLK